MKRSLVFVACAVVLALAVGLEAVEKEPPIEVVQVPLTWHQAALADGEALYMELCAVCHGADGTGGGPAAKALTKAVPDLTLIRLHGDGIFPRAAVERTIRGEGDIPAHGTLDMPIWGRAFTDARPDHKPGRRWAQAEQRIQNLTAYLETIQQ